MISYYCLLLLYLTWLRYHIFDRRPAAHTGAGICWIAYPRGLVHTPWLTQINDYTSTDSASCNSCCAVCVVYNEMTILISARWSATSFSFLTGQVSLPISILLRTQLLYSLSLLINDISLLVSSGNNCLNLFHSIRILASTAASASPSTLSISPWSQNLSTTSRFALAPISTLVRPVLIKGFEQSLQINDFITLYMLPFIPLHFLCTHFWQLVGLHRIKLLPTPLPHTPHGHHAVFCISSWRRRSPLSITLVLFIFTLITLFSTISFHSLSLLIRSSSVSAITTKASAYNSSHGKATLNQGRSQDFISTEAKG